MARKKNSKKEEDFQKKQLELANKFKDAVVKKYGKIIKSVVVFGSLTRKDFHAKSDVDMLVIVDDVAARFTPETKDIFDDEIYKIAKKISKDIVVQPAWTLTEFWDMARIGHPLLCTIVRDGWALYDTGFFIPVRKLLELGKIPTTLEAVERFMQDAPKKIQRVEAGKLFMVAEDIYYAMLNSAQAVLMFIGIVPPPPKNTPTVLKEHMVDEGLLEQEYVNQLKEIIELRKRIEHKEIQDISGANVDKYIAMAKKFISRMEQLLMKLQKDRKEDIVKRNYEVMIRAAVGALKNLGKLPPDPKDLPKAIKEELVDKNKINPFYLDVLKEVITMRKMVDEDKIDEIPQKDIELVREYVRRFIQDVTIYLEPQKKTKSKKKTTTK